MHNDLIRNIKEVLRFKQFCISYESMAYDLYLLFGLISRQKE